MVVWSACVWLQVRAGDGIFLCSVSNERYLSAQLSYLQNVESDAQKVGPVYMV